MAIERFPILKPQIAHLFRLANGSLEPHAFRSGCEQIATFEASLSDDVFCRFSLGGGPILSVVLKAELTGGQKSSGWPVYRARAVSCAILPICWWETFLQSQHVNLNSWQSEWVEFDTCFSDALANTVEVLGPPLMQGVDTDANGHRFAIWRGESALLILQQSAYDPQFGLDVNYWIQPWTGPDPLPTSPFIDWLVQMASGA